MIARALSLLFCVGLSVSACGSQGAAKANTAVNGRAGAGGISATCGNGKVDPGEDCEGNNLNGSTCTSLGFQSGTLACMSSCRYNTSACVGQLTLTVNASRTTCAAPCGVFFDATTTTGLMGGDYVIANFSWDFDSTNVDPKGVHEQTIGFATGHVFEIPGTYQVSVRVRDQAGHAGSTTVPIAVSAWTGSTIYVAANGNDMNAGATTTQPLATLTAALNKQTGPGASILLRRGDTFSVGSNTISIQGPCLIGAYADPTSPSTAAPILNSTIAGGYKEIIALSGGSDARFVDIHIVSAGASNGISLSNSPHALVERVEIEGLGYVDSSSETVGEAFYVDHASSPAFFVDSHLHDFMGYGLYGDTVNRLAIVGNTTDHFGGGDHGVRLAGGALSYVAENTVMSNDTNSAESAITIRGDNQNVVVVNNRVNRLIEFTPQNETSVEHVSNALAEGNIINDSRTTGFYSNALGIAAQHIVARNNIFVNSPTSVEVTGPPQLPINFVDQIYIYNNTSYFFPITYSKDYGANFVHHGGTTGTMVVENNIFAHGLTLTNEQTSLMEIDNQGTVIEDHNLSFGPNGIGQWVPASGTGSIVGDPKFISTDPTNPNAFRLSAGSAAIDIGATAPVYQDFAGTQRPLGAGWDVGAFEFSP